MTSFIVNTKYDHKLGPLVKIILHYPLFINTPDSFAIPIVGGEHVTWGCKTADKDQLELVKTGVLGAQAHVCQFNYTERNI